MRQIPTPTFLLTLTALCSGVVNAGEPRFVPLDHNTTPLSATEREQWQEWPCIFDQRTGLLWEGKSHAAGLHQRHNTYNWFNPDPAHNGGLAGEPGARQCRDGAQQQACDTRRFVQAVNDEGLCKAHDWRLPRREELRSLVNYSIPYPGPTIDMQAFPNSIAQFYWSTDASASEPLEAWGIGFAFGFDYAYFKNNRVHVRLVSDSLRESRKK
jgi:Protein of unknown function (DUF1566)